MRDWVHWFLDVGAGETLDIRYGGLMLGNYLSHMRYMDRGCGAGGGTSV